MPAAPVLTQSVRPAHDSLMRTSLWLIMSAWLVAGGAGCSSGMKYKVDDAALDNVSASEKQGGFAPKNEGGGARSELPPANTKREAIDRDRDVAKNEKKQAELEVEKAATEEESAVAS